MNLTKGVFFALISAMAFGISPILISMTYSMGNNSLMMAFLRNLLVLPVLLSIIKFRCHSLKVSKNQFIKLLIMTILGVCTSLMCLYTSYTFISPSLASSIHFIYPLIVAISAVILFKEELSILRKIALVCSLTGIFLFVDFKAGNNDLLKGVGLALISGSAYAFYIVYMAKSGLLRLSTFVVTFYTCLISAIFLGLVTFFTGNLKPGEMDINGWLITIVISVMITILGTMFTQLAVLNAGTTITSVMSTLEPITTITIGVLLFNESLSLVKLIACSLILTSVLLLALDQKYMAKKRSENVEAYEDIINDEF